MSKTREGISTSKGFIPKIYVPVEINLLFENATGYSGNHYSVSYYHGGEKVTINGDISNGSWGLPIVADLGSYICFGCDLGMFQYDEGKLPFVKKSDDMNTIESDYKATFIVVGSGTASIEFSAKG